MRRTSARVSIPAIPGIPNRCMNASRDSRERQLLGVENTSFTANPCRKGLVDSSSSGLAPTFPICVQVIATSCPA
jgi:hypothetical protein